MRTPSAGALLVGDELLSGKVRDANGSLLASELFRCGHRLRRIVICPDDVGEIVVELRRLHSAVDLVFTSGGVGPTHDDVTLEAIAAALERPLQHREDMEAALRAFYGARFGPVHAAMARLPRGAELLSLEEVPFPVIHVDRVLVLPGVPRFFEAKVRALRPWLRARSEVRFHACWLDVEASEGTFAAMLREVAEAHPQVAVGSYPRERPDGSWYVRVAFDAVEDAAARAARGEVARRLAEMGLRVSAEGAL